MASDRWFASRALCTGRKTRRALTLVELLVAVSIVGTLMALMLPAVQSSRETARKAECREHLRQLAVAMQRHVTTFERFPGNGWGYLWFGEQNRGTGAKQPGGWVYNIVPYLQSEDVLENPKDLVAHHLGLFNCPSRAPGLSPANPFLKLRNIDWVPMVGKTDYAACEGDFITDTQHGPLSLSPEDVNSYDQWRDTSKATGVFFQRSEIRPSQVQDGLSNTYLLGEKYVSTTGYYDFSDSGYDQTLFIGVDLDLNRWVIDPPLQDSRKVQERRFGSPHSDSCHFAFCDGRVVEISYWIDGEVHRMLGNRRDHGIIPWDEVLP